MPNLRTLEVRMLCLSEWYDIPQFILLRERQDYSANLPRLHHLIISGTFFPIYLAVRPLRRLEIFDCSDYCEYHLSSEIRTISTEVLVESLARCPDLEYLKIVNSAPDNVIGEEISKPSLHLPRVREYVVEDEDSEYGDCFLQCFTVPSIARLAFLCEGCPIRTAMPSCTLSEIFSSLDGLVLGLYTDERDLASCFLRGTVDAAERMSITVRDALWKDGQTCSETIREFVELFSISPNVRTLEVHLPGSLCPEEGDWSTVFEGFPLVRALTVHVDSSAELLAALCCKTACPDLEQLSILCADWNTAQRQALVSMVESRAASGTPLMKLIYTFIGSRLPVQDSGGTPETRSLMISDEHLTRLKAVIPEVSLMGALVA